MSALQIFVGAIAASAIVGVPVLIATADNGGTETTATVHKIIDGDTLATNWGKVRLIGIDTPEQNQCGYESATAALAAYAPVGSTVTLVAPAGVQDKDSYDRLLRYVVNPAGGDSGLHQIEGGWADARYDSTDGYDHHDQESAYHAADRDRWRDSITACSPHVKGDTMAQEAAAVAKAKEDAAAAARAKVRADAAQAPTVPAPPAPVKPAPAQPAPVKPAPVKPAPVKPAPAPAPTKPPTAAPKQAPPPAPAPAPKPVAPVPDKYTGCRAYGPGGTSIDDKGRPYTKIDCTTKLPI